MASIRGAISGLTFELIEDHMAEHVVEAESDAARRDGAAELIDSIRTYLK